MRAAATVIQSYYILTVNLLRVQHILGVEQKLEHLTIQLWAIKIFNLRIVRKRICNLSYNDEWNIENVQTKCYKINQQMWTLFWEFNTQITNKMFKR